MTVKVQLLIEAETMEAVIDEVRQWLNVQAHEPEVAETEEARRERAQINPNKIFRQSSQLGSATERKCAEGHIQIGRWPCGALRDQDRDCRRPASR